MKLHSEQVTIVDEPKSFIVQGCAGSGKTLMVIEKAKKISLYSDVLIIAFTRALKSYIEGKLVSFKKVRIYTYGTWNNFKEEEKYSNFTLVDEVQDFSLTQIEKLRKFTKEEIYLFGDDDQQLYDKTFDDEKTANISEIKSFFNFPLYQLNINFRSNIAIANFVKNIYKKTFKLYDNCKPNTPKILRFEKIQEEIEFIAMFLLEFKNTKINIGILLAENRKKAEISFGRNGKILDMSTPGINGLRILLHDLGVTCGYKDHTIDDLDFSKNTCINLLTYHSSKGLEFDVVIIPFINKYTRRKAPLYTAMTRAKTELIITYTSEVALWIDEPIV